MIDYVNVTLIPWLIGVIPSVLRVVIAAVIGVVLSGIIPKIVNKIWGKARVDTSALHYVITAIRIVLWGLVVVVILDVLGFPVASLLTVVAAVGAAIALAIKDNLANISSGIILLFTKPFKAGDFISVAGTSGVIKQIELMHTYIDTLSNTRVAVPNTTMMGATIENFNAHDIRRQDLTFTIAQSNDLAVAKQTLLDVGLANPMVMDKPEAPMVAVTQQGAAGVTLMLRYWSTAEDYFTSQFEIIEQVKLAFDAKGITVPYQPVVIRHEA